LPSVRVVGWLLGWQTAEEQTVHASQFYHAARDCAELNQFDFRRGAAEARGVKLRFALAQEGCSTACLDGEADVWHGQSAHSSLRSSLPSCTLHPKHGDPV